MAKIHPVVQQLAHERLVRHLSYRQMASRSQLGASVIHSWEHGDRGPTLEALEIYANSLGYTIALKKL